MICTFNGKELEKGDRVEVAYTHFAGKDYDPPLLFTGTIVDPDDHCNESQRKKGFTEIGWVSPYSVLVKFDNKRENETNEMDKRGDVSQVRTDNYDPYIVKLL